MALTKQQVANKRAKMDLDSKILASKVKIQQEKENLANLAEKKKDLIANTKGR